MLKAILRFFLHPGINSDDPSFGDFHWGSTSPMSTDHERDMKEIAFADYKLSKEVAQKNLILLHRSMMISLVAVVVAIVAVTFAIRNKPAIQVNVPAPVVQQMKGNT